MSLTIIQALATAQIDPVDARVLLRHVLKVDSAHLIAHADLALTDAQSERFNALAARRRAGEPVAYITGTREFFSLEFKVTSAVLIPRPETELLVEFALDRLASDQPCRVLDLGTGSGCIAISIARHRRHAQVVAVDSSAAALAVAHDNAHRLLEAYSEAPSPSTGEGRDGGVVASMRATPTLPLPPQGGGGSNLQFVQSDWLGTLSGQRFDLIVSNPPYVSASDPHLAQGDLRFEPPAALAAGGDGLECIRLIVASAPQYLVHGGWLAFEHGYDQATRVGELLAQAGFRELIARTDLSGIARVSAGRWNP